MKPLISIITPCYNGAAFIESTIHAVRNQTFENFEWFIVDDGSTDDSVQLIKKYQELDKRIKLMELKTNKGPAGARNVGIKSAVGTYMTFIDADDLWLPHFLEENLKHIKNSEGFLCASYHLYDETLTKRISDLIVPCKAAYSDILKTNTIGSLTPFIDVSKLGKEYMPDIPYRQDMGLWLKYLKKVKYVVGIRECLAIYRIRKSSHSRSKTNLLKHQWYFYREVAELSVVKSLYFFIIWSYYGLKKYYF